MDLDTGEIKVKDQEYLIENFLKAQFKKRMKEIIITFSIKDQIAKTTCNN